MPKKIRLLPKKLGPKEKLGLAIGLAALIILPLTLKATSSPTYNKSEAAGSSSACQTACDKEGYKTGTCASSSTSTKCLGTALNLGRDYCPKYHLGKWNTICCCDNKDGDTGLVKKSPSPTPNPATLPDLVIQAVDTTVDPVKLLCHEGRTCYGDGSCNYNGTYSIDRIVATVTNLNSANRASNIPVFHWINDQYMGQGKINYLTPNFATKAVSLYHPSVNMSDTLRCQQNEIKTVKVCVNLSKEQMDPFLTKSQKANYKQVLESNYDNNCLTVSLSCNPQVCCEKGCTPSCCDPAKGL